MKIEFVDDAQQEEFLGNKQGVPELEDVPEGQPGPEPTGPTEPGDHSSDDQEENFYDSIEDMDIFIAKFLLSLIDDTRATALSTWAMGNLDNSDNYRYYKDLDAPEHKALVMAAAYVVRKYRLSKSPEVILLLGLGMSTFMVWNIARADRKERKEAEAKAAEELQQKKQEELFKQQQQQQRQQQQTPKGKVINMNQQQQSLFI